RGGEGALLALPRHRRRRRADRQRHRGGDRRDHPGPQAGGLVRRSLDYPRALRPEAGALPTPRPKAGENLGESLMAVQPAVLDWLKNNHTSLVRDLADLVAIRSVSTDGEHQKEIDQSAALTCEQMRRAGLQKVEVLRTGGSNPYAYGEWLGAAG